MASSVDIHPIEALATLLLPKHPMHLLHDLCTERKHVVSTSLLVERMLEMTYIRLDASLWATHDVLWFLLGSRMDAEYRVRRAEAQVVRGSREWGCGGLLGDG